MTEIATTTTMHRAQSDMAFKTIAPGIHFSFLRRHDPEDTTGKGGITLLVRMEKGAQAQRHGHPGGEETYLVSGRLRLGSTVLSPGDYLWTAAGEIHEGVAEEESLFLVVLPGGFELTPETEVLVREDA